MSRRVLTTRFTELVGCTVPIQLAGMPEIATPELVTAVARAGGLGMIGAGLTPPPLLTRILDAFPRDLNGAIGVTFLMPFLDHECVEVAAPRARVIDFFYGEPDAALVTRVHDGGALAAWQIGSLEEAKVAVAAGCDFIIAQGIEAGGHVRGQVALLPLLAEVLDAVTVPVVAAGGIGNARTMAAVLAAGAAAVRLGTCFVAAAESGAHPVYVDALIAARAEDTVLTEAFSVMWPNAPHRVLRSSIVAAERFAGEVTGTMVVGGERMPVPRFAVPCPTKETTGAVEAMALYAGHSVDAVRAVRPAAAIMRELCAGVEKRLDQWRDDEQVHPR